MMSVRDFVKLQAFEIGFLAILVVLPNFVIVVGVGLILAIVGYKVLNKKTLARVPVEGRAVFITGCDRGIGYAFARRLVSLGFKVFAGCYRPDGEGAKTLKLECGNDLHIVSIDVTKDDSVKGAFNAVRSSLGDNQLWAVVNNAGQASMGEVEFCTMDVYKSMMEVNMFGMARVTKAFLPLVRRAKGRVLNITSVKGRLYVPKESAYTMTKYAAEAFSDILRIEMRKWGVKVSIIEPGNFGGITSIIKNENYDRMKTEMETMWETATPEVKEAYGKDYHFQTLEALAGEHDTAYSSLAPVIDAMEDAMVNAFPRARYLIGGSSSFYDIYKVCAMLNQYLPEFLMDFIVVRCFWTSNIVPQALRT